MPRRHATAPAGPAVTAAGGGGGLMSPHQFAHSTTTTNTALEEVDVGLSKSMGGEPVSLSKEQMQQALLYLIKVGVGYAINCCSAITCYGLSGIVYTGWAISLFLALGV